MLAIGKRPEVPKPTEAEKGPASTHYRYAHRPLPGGGRIMVTLTDGTPVGVIRYDLEQKDGMPLLLRAFANVLEERANRSETP